jgi:hypothetical protein
MKKGRMKSVIPVGAVAAGMLLGVMVYFSPCVAGGTEVFQIAYRDPRNPVNEGANSRLENIHRERETLRERHRDLGDAIRRQQEDVREQTKDADVQLRLQREEWHDQKQVADERSRQLREADRERRSDALSRLEAKNSLRQECARQGGDFMDNNKQGACVARSVFSYRKEAPSAANDLFDQVRKFILRVIKKGAQMFQDREEAP